MNQYLIQLNKLYQDGKRLNMNRFLLEQQAGEVLSVWLKTVDYRYNSYDMIIIHKGLPY